MKLEKLISMKNIQKNLRFRLVVAVPLTMFCFSLASGMLVFGIARQTFINYKITNVAEIILYMVILVSTFACLAAISGVLLARAIITPIKNITVQAENIARGGVASEPTHSKDAPELDILTNAFNKMVISIDKYITDSYILSSLPEGIITIDSNGNIISFNKVAEEVLGYDSSQAEGMPYTTVFSADNGALFQMIEAVLKKQQAGLFSRTTISTKEEIIPVEVNVYAMKNERGWQGDPILVVFKSLTQVETIRRQIRQVDNLAAIGSMATGLAHEIRNPLSYLYTLTELLQEEMNENDSKRAYLEAITKGINRLNNIVEDLLNFSRNSNIVEKYVDINELLKEVISQIKESIASDREIQVVERYEPHLPPLFASPERLFQVFSNIIANAFEATPDGGSITISTQYQAPNREAEGFVVTSQPETGSDSQKTPMLNVSIANTGSYISQENMKKLFTPFFTTKQNGTGLGLFIAHQIVSYYGGQIEVSSEEGEGTTFHLKLVGERSDCFVPRNKAKPSVNKVNIKERKYGALGQ
jgi:PAS domain S-box-containing protein